MSLAQTWMMRGLELKRRGHFEEALQAYDLSLKAEPTYYPAIYNKGNLLFYLKNYIGALAAYELTITLKPDYPEAWFNKGLTFYHLQKLAPSLAAYDQVLALNPKDHEAWTNRGVILGKLHQFKLALTSHQQAINLKADFAVAYFNQAMAFYELKEYQEAFHALKQAVSIDEHLDYPSGFLVYLQLLICEWDNLDNLLSLIKVKIQNNECVGSPFWLLAIVDDPSLLHQASKSWNKNQLNTIYAENDHQQIPFFSRPQKRKIRIGYFSTDFYEHAVMSLMVGVFELHDENQFEIYAFILAPPVNDAMNHRLQMTFKQFIDVNDKSDEEIIGLSRSLGIDIAVDLTGNTRSNRANIFAQRLAPIQVNYLGYPGTMGSHFYDYLIADPILIPLESFIHYSENIVYLPNSYQPNDHKRTIPENKLTRHQYGLRDDQFVFCCFNNNFKITPAIFTSWIKILQAVPNGVLWLLEDTKEAKQNLQKHFANHNIAGDRLIFAKRIPQTEHIERYQLADLFLDTFPYNAHTTASDALWAGLPLITIMGKSFASRVASSLLTAINLPELITNSRAEYELLAIELATNKDKLSAVKHRLRNHRFTTPLFDTKAITTNLENLYKKMNQVHQNYGSPKHV